MAARVSNARALTTAHRRPGAESPAWGWLRWVALGAALLGAWLWSYWPTASLLYRDWQADADYSAGQLVPLVAALLVWWRRKELAAIPARPCWWGLALLGAGVALQLVGLADVRESLERYGMVVSAAGAVLLVLGRGVFAALRWVLAFGLLMVPLPGKLHNMVSGPLQNLATSGAVFMLETFGVHVSRQGNVMTLNGDTPVAVAEACSGLRMLTAMVVVAATLSFLIRRPAWQRCVLVLSSVAIGVIANLVRLAVTAVLFLVASSRFAERFFHDFAGLAIMPPAVLMLAGELWLMNRLVVPDRASPNASRRAGRGSGKARKAKDAARRRNCNDKADST